MRHDGDSWAAARGPTSTPASGGEAREAELRRAFDDLRERVERRLPHWKSRGPEDPAEVLLEVFAEALAEVRTEARQLESKLLPRFLETLGEEPRWAEPARGVVVFVPREDLNEPRLLRAGSVVSARRAQDAPPLRFETETDVWCSPAHLRRAYSVQGAAHTELSLGSAGDPSSPAQLLFPARGEIARHLYLGDPVLAVLRAARGFLLLEWRGVSPSLVDGRWEYSSRSGWCPLRVDFEEVRVENTRRLRLRLHGPLPDLAEHRLDGTLSAWIRCALPADRRVGLQPAQWVGAALAQNEKPVEEAPEDGVRLDFPRPVGHVLTFVGERWDDLSLSRAGSRIPSAATAWDPAVYLGYDRAESVSTYFALADELRGAEGDDAPSLVWEYSTGRTFRAFSVDDGTASFTRSGCVSFGAPEGWEMQELGGERLLWVRARWVGGEYARAPRVRALIPGGVGVVQGHTLRRHVCEATLRGGRGVVRIGFPEGEPERFSRIAWRREAEEWRECENVAVRRRGNGEYLLGIEGAGDGRVVIKIPGLRVGLGARGNVAPGTLCILEADVPGVAQVVQPLAASGGADGEDEARFRQRLHAEWGRGDRAVTERDYRLLCRAWDAGLRRVEAQRDRLDPSRVVLTVVPEDGLGVRGLPGEEFSTARGLALERRLLERAPVGTIVEVRPPLYVPLEIVLHETEPSVATFLPRLSDRLSAFFHPLTGGENGRGFPRCAWWRDDELVTLVCIALASDPTTAAAAAVDMSWRLVPPAVDFADLAGRVAFPVLERIVLETLD